MTTVVLYGREGLLPVRRRSRGPRTGPRATPVRRSRSGTSIPTTALLRAYLERIPVVTIDGVEAFELFVDEPSSSAG